MRASDAKTPGRAIMRAYSEVHPCSRADRCHYMVSQGAHLQRTHLKRAGEEAVLALLIPLGDPVLRAQREKLPPRPRKSVNGGTRRERKQARRFASGHVSLDSASHMPHAQSLKPTSENLHTKPCTWRDARLKARTRARPASRRVSRHTGPRARVSTPALMPTNKTRAFWDSRSKPPTTGHLRPNRRRVPCVPWAPTRGCPRALNRRRTHAF